MNYCIHNEIVTPDGTSLVCEHNHDYKTHVDANGETYMNDGLGYYVRRSCNQVEATDKSVWSEGTSHETIRKHLKWGTIIKGHRVYKTLKDLDTDHIENILATQNHISDFYRQCFNNELDWRAN